MMITRFVLIVLLLGTVGCSATYIRATVTDNPLDRVEQKAQDDWSIERVDAYTLHLSNFWPILSFFFPIAYVTSHAILVYDPAGTVLHIRYYLRMISPLYLFIPITRDADSTCRPDSYKCSDFTYLSRQEEVLDILRWSEASVISRRAGKRSETFPPQESIPSQPY
jgi:hypothetical protein